MLRWLAARASSIYFRSVTPDELAAAGAREMQFEIVAFGVEHVDRMAAVAFDTAVKFAQFFGRLQRAVVIFTRHVKSLVGDSILIQGVAVDRPRPLEKYDIITTALEAVELLRHAVNRK